jgi:hypothetical protein
MRFMERIQAGGCAEIQILKFDVFRAHLTVRCTSKRTGNNEHAREQHRRRASDAL